MTMSCGLPPVSMATLPRSSRIVWIGGRFGMVKKSSMSVLLFAVKVVPERGHRAVYRTHCTPSGRTCLLVQKRVQSDFRRRAGLVDGGSAEVDPDYQRRWSGFVRLIVPLNLPVSARPLFSDRPGSDRASTARACPRRTGVATTPGEAARLADAIGDAVSHGWFSPGFHIL